MTPPFLSSGPAPSHHSHYQANPHNYLGQVEGNREARAAIRARRAFALQQVLFICSPVVGVNFLTKTQKNSIHPFQMGNQVAALVELDEATKILPGNLKLKKDADMLRESINGGCAAVQGE